MLSSMADSKQIVHLLHHTLNADGNVVRSATELLDSLSLTPDFPFSLLTIVAGYEDHGVRIAAATYLKNLLRRSLYGEGQPGSVSKEFRNQLLRALLHTEPSILKVLVEAFRIIVQVEFVKNNDWPEIVPELKYAIQHSNFINGQIKGELRTLNALTVLQALVRPFQYFLNPKVVKEPVPLQLELIANEILVPLLAVFHNFTSKGLAVNGIIDVEIEKILLLVGKCMYYTVRSYMPSALSPLLSSFCGDLYAILDSLSIDKMLSSEDAWQVRVKMGKRSLLIFCFLITRHRKYCDKLMPEIVNCVLRIFKHSKDISKLNTFQERIFSSAFDVISHVLETGPGWRLVSPHFSTLLDYAIFPAILLNDKDTMEWEEDADEFLRKTFPSDLDDISGWRDDLFTARKSAINLLGVISMSKGPPLVTSGSSQASSKRKKGEKNKGKHQRYSMGELLVIPFLSKFPIPTDANASDISTMQNYFGVLMGYGSLQDFLSEQKTEYTSALIQIRILPLYKVHSTLPFLVAAANWVLGELAACLSDDIRTDVYSALLKALAMPDSENMSCYPVRVTAAGAIAKLLDNDYSPPEWLPLLQVIIQSVGCEVEDASFLFQLLSSAVEVGSEEVAALVPSVVPTLADIILKSIPSDQEPWPQVVERGFAALAVMANTWQEFESNEVAAELDTDFASGRATIARAFSALLQQAWLVNRQTEAMDDDGDSCQQCVDDASILLGFITLSVDSTKTHLELNLSKLLVVWSEQIANGHAWEESEDFPVFDCIKEVVKLQKNFDMWNFFEQMMPSPPSPPLPKQSIIQNICAFVGEAITQHPSATRRACLCIHTLLHGLNYSFGGEDLKKSLVVTFSEAAVSRFRETNLMSSALRKPLLLAVASCYLCYPDIVEKILDKDEGGFIVWVSALRSNLSSSSEANTSSESETKLTVITLAKLADQLVQKGNLFNDKFREETEEEFLERYAKAAAALEDNSGIEEGDEDDDEDLEFDFIEEFDEQNTLRYIFEKYQQVLQGHAISPELTSMFLDSFPEYKPFFHH
ncbi:hypothetical protein V2J09_021098 [Rumex salicifolius]